MMSGHRGREGEQGGSRRRLVSDGDDLSIQFGLRWTSSSSTSVLQEKPLCGEDDFHELSPLSFKSSSTMSSSFRFLSASAPVLNYSPGCDKINLLPMDSGDILDSKPEASDDTTTSLTDYNSEQEPVYVPTTAQKLWIEVSNGITLELRGAQETWRCIENDYYLPTSCSYCSINLFCIMDASYIICPSCRVVSPLEDGAVDGGVGLGFTFEDLARCQKEILQVQRGPHN